MLMSITIATLFVIAYLAIALEHPLRVHKTASALLGATLCWSLYALLGSDVHLVQSQLAEHIGETAGIIVFLMGAMTIVELIDAHGGFSIITNHIHTRNVRTLLWVIAWMTFFLSAVLDNLTTTIVMVSLVRKLLTQREDRMLFAGIIVIAANAGGAWSPIGDVTTTLLWMGGQVSTGALMTHVLLPSIVNLLVPLLVLSWWIKSKPSSGTQLEARLQESAPVSHKEKRWVFVLGIGSLLLVPVFKALTHLPPWLGILFGLGILWVATEFMHRNKTKHQLGVARALQRIDLPSILFFLGILLAVGALQATGLLGALALGLNQHVGNVTGIVMLSGVLSAIVDNVPLVAAGMGMYPLEQFPQNHFLWPFLSYCAGTGGSMLVIGSAAGVAAMGIEKITFGWYLRKIAPLATLGYVAGAGTYLLQRFF